MPEDVCVHMGTSVYSELQNLYYVLVISINNPNQNYTAPYIK